MVQSLDAAGSGDGAHDYLWSLERSGLALRERCGCLGGWLLRFCRAVQSTSAGVVSGTSVMATTRAPESHRLHLALSNPTSSYYI